MEPGSIPGHAAKLRVGSQLENANNNLAAFGIVTETHELEWFLEQRQDDAKVVVDTEFGGPDKKNPQLLGVSVAFRGTEGRILSFYVPFIKWDSQLSTFFDVASEEVRFLLAGFLSAEKTLIAHNSEADRPWIELLTSSKFEWHCTRKMWHLSDSEDSPHGFGLKTAQVELLKWSETNEKELAEEVSESGGSLSSGGHYLGYYGTLASYAVLDSYSTLRLYEHLSDFFNVNDYWDFLVWRTRYHEVISEATKLGVEVDVEKLLDGREILARKLEAAEKEIREVCKTEIEALEENWFAETVEGYSQDHARQKFINNPSRHRRFNPNSSNQRALLVYNVLGCEIKDKTKGGKPKTDRASMANLDHPVSAAFVRYSQAEAVLKLVDGYIQCLVTHEDGTVKLHCPYNTSATVSDRLGGFKPYALNMPFSEAVMEAFKVPAGHVGVHADVASLEPCLTAAFSKDPTLLKVNRDGLGDVYLDFALDVFPNNKELQAEYDPWVPLKPEVKKKFKKERDACKIGLLALGYTGTESTIYKNLIKNGFDITKGFARALVQTYHMKFRAVDDLAGKLKTLLKRDGFIRNVAGRILQIPDKLSKDTLNRFIQSGGHDLVSEWVLEIHRMAQERPEMGLKPLLPDIHDSTSWIVRTEYAEDAKQIFNKAMERLNQKTNLDVTLKAEVKFFTTLAGLKD